MEVRDIFEMKLNDIEAAIGGPGDAARQTWQKLQRVLSQSRAVAQDRPGLWRKISKEILQPSLPWKLHESLYRATYRHWDTFPAPVWVPTPEGAAATNLGRFMSTFEGDFMWDSFRRGDPCLDFPLLQRISVDNPEVFWPPVLRTLGLHFHHPPRCMVDTSAGVEDARWLPGATLNIAECCFRGRDPDSLAIVYATEPGASRKRPSLPPAHPGGAEAPHGVIAGSAGAGVASNGNAGKMVDDASRGGHAVHGTSSSSSSSSSVISSTSSAGGVNVRGITVGELRAQCERVAAGLATLGLHPGDAVAIDMPMTAVSVAAYLGTILAGMVVVSIADSFAADAISSRLRIAGARAVFTQDVIVRGGALLPLYARVVEAQAPMAIVIPGVPEQEVALLREQDVTWSCFLSRAEQALATLAMAPPSSPSPSPSPSPSTPPMAGSRGEGGSSLAAVAVPSHALCNILFSSGTTGEPKAIPWTHVTPIRCAVDAWAHQDVRRGDIVCWPTNLGWMMGPWLVFAALLNNATIALYEGSPLGADFGRFVQVARVTMLGLVPSIVKAWRASGCMAGVDWSAIRCFSSSGESSNPGEYLWLSSLAGYKPVIEYCGGTEIGGGFLCGSLLQPQAPSHFSTPTLGARLVILDDNGAIIGGSYGHDQRAGGSGAAAARVPCQGPCAIVPPMLGLSTLLLNASHHEVYFEGMPRLPESGTPLRRHGDEVELVAGGYYLAHGRVDDTMNLGGIKVSSIEIERICNAEAPELVLETAAIGVPPAGGGPEELVIVAVLRDQGAMHAQAALTSATLRASTAGLSGMSGGGPAAMQGVSPEDAGLALQAGVNAAGVAAELQLRFQKAIKGKLNPLFRVSRVVLAESLPRTASNKVMRRVLRKQHAMVAPL